MFSPLNLTLLKLMTIFSIENQTLIGNIVEALACSVTSIPQVKPKFHLKISIYRKNCDKMVMLNDDKWF